jgi:hypothetical protein
MISVSNFMKMECQILCKMAKIMLNLIKFRLNHPVILIMN